MNDKILILAITSGRDHLKFKLYDMRDGVCITEGLFEDIGRESSYKYKAKSGVISGKFNTEKGYSSCIYMMLGLLKEEKIIDDESDIDAVVFKTVMAGESGEISFVTKKLLEDMESFSKYAPLDNPSYISLIKAFMEIKEDWCLVCAFDSEFHKTIPEKAKIYPINNEMAEKYGIKKYGYHGAAHAYNAKVAQKLGYNNIISCHLDKASSLCAIENGKSIDTTMGFSPQGGIFMSGSCGDIDPFAVFYLMEKEDLSVNRTLELLSQKSGLYGVSGISADAKDLISSDSEKSILALKSYCYNIKKYIGAFYAALGKCEAIFFSGETGEKIPIVRQMSLEGLENMGIMLSKENNEQNDITLREISIKDSDVKIYINPSNEEKIIAERAYDFIERHLASEM